MEMGSYGGGNKGGMNGNGILWRFQEAFWKGTLQYSRSNFECLRKTRLLLLNLPEDVVEVVRIQLVLFGNLLETCLRKLLLIGVPNITFLKSMLWRKAPLVSQRMFTWLAHRRLSNRFRLGRRQISLPGGCLAWTKQFEWRSQNVCGLAT